MADKKQKRPVMAIVITSLGIAGTAVYVGFLVWLTRNRWGWLADPETPLNSLGDFLAGAFGPLAIWWLVLGYFQQGIELRQNSEAISQQAFELERAVEQHTKMANAQEAAQARADQEKQEQRQRAIPKLIITSGGQSSGTHYVDYNVKVANLGVMACRNLVITGGPESRVIFQADVLEPNHPQTITFNVQRKEFPIAWSVKASFYDGLGESGATFLQMFAGPAHLAFLDQSASAPDWFDDLYGEPQKGK